MNPVFSYVRDSFIPADQASLLIGDLSIQRGYGIFDYFKTLIHVPIFLDDHLDRFYHSAAQLRLPVGHTREALEAILKELQQKNNIPDSGIRITLTGGYSPDGYSLSQPNLIITQQPLLFPICPECPKPFRLVTWPHQRQLPETKTIDYLMAIWLQPYIREQEADDVLYHHNGVITECPRCNFFVVTADDTLVTPARNMLKGITRMKVLELAAPTLKTEERDITLEELPTIKEAFITSTGKHIVPVSDIDDIKIGHAQSAGPAPGPITQRLNKQLFQLVIACLLLFLSLPAGAQQLPANPTDSIFKDWYFTPTGVSGRIPLTRPKYRSYFKISHLSANFVTVQKYNPAGILLSTTAVHFAGGRLSLMTETNRWGAAVDSMWFKPDGDNDFIVTQKAQGENPYFPCKAYRYTYRNNLLKEILCLADSTKPGKNQEGVSHYVFERCDDPARFGLIKSLIYYTDIDMPAISNKTDCHKLVNEYDQKGNLLSSSLYGPDEKPTNNRYGVSLTKFKYDGDDNEKEAAYFDAWGLPVITTLGYALVSFEYKKGFLTRETFYAADGKIIIRSTSLGDSVAIINRKYDQEGKQTEETFFDADDKPTDDIKGCYKTEYSYSAAGMLVRQSNFGLNPRMTAAKLLNPSHRYERDSIGRLVGIANMTEGGMVITDINTGAFLLKFRLDNWGRVVSTTLWQNDSTKMLSLAGYHESVTQYNDDGLAAELRYYDYDGDPTTLNLAYSRELISYNDLGRVEAREYFVGDRPTLLEGHTAAPSHFHSIHYGYDLLGRLRSFDYLDSHDKPINAILELGNGQLVQCQHVDVDYQGFRLADQTIRDSGNLAPPVVLDCSTGNCLPAAGLRIKPGRFSGANQGDRSYHGRIRIDSLFDGQLAFIGEDSLLLFLNSAEQLLSVEGCAEFYRVAPMNKYCQPDGTVTDYYQENDSVAASLSYDKGNLDGPCILFYKNGRVKERGDYIKNGRAGVWEYFFENGQKEKVIRFTPQGPLLLECYTSDGKILAQNGNGRFGGLVVTNTVRNPIEYRMLGDIKNGLPDGEWQLFHKFRSAPIETEKFSAGKFRYGISNFQTTRSQYRDRYYSTVESIHLYESADQYGQNDFCLFAGKRATTIPATSGRELFSGLEEGFAGILRSNKYRYYSGWIFVDIKFDANGKIIGKYVRLYHPDDDFKGDILHMLDRFDNHGSLVLNGLNTPYEKFCIILVESNEAVIPEHLLMTQRMPASLR